MWFAAISIIPTNFTARTSRSTSALAEIAHELVGAGEEVFKALKVSLREHEIDQVRAFVYHVLHAGPFTASNRGAGVPHDQLFVAVNRDGVPGPLLVFQRARLDLAHDDLPPTGAEGVKLFHGILLRSRLRKGRSGHPAAPSFLFFPVALDSLGRNASALLGLPDSQCDKLARRAWHLVPCDAIQLAASGFDVAT